MKNSSTRRRAPAIKRGASPLEPRTDQSGNTTRKGHPRITHRDAAGAFKPAPFIKPPKKPPTATRSNKRGNEDAGV